MTITITLPAQLCESLSNGHTQCVYAPLRPTLSRRFTEELDGHRDADVPCFFSSRIQNTGCNILQIIYVCFFFSSCDLFLVLLHKFCVPFFMFLQSLKCIFFPEDGAIPNDPRRGKEMGNENGAQCKSGTLVCTRCLTYCQRNTYTKQRGRQPTRFDVTMIFLVLCVSSTWLVRKKKKKICLLIFSPPTTTTTIIWTHFCISIRLLDNFIFEHGRDAFPFCWKISAFQTVVIVWHSVVGGHVMVCVAQPLGLLVRTYKNCLHLSTNLFINNKAAFQL